MELPLDRADVDSIIKGLFWPNVKLDQIIDFLEIDGEEEEEADPDS